MITEVKEQSVKVKKPGGESYWRAVIRNGEATIIEALTIYPTCKSLEGYILFLKEVIEAIKNTEP